MGSFRIAGLVADLIHPGHDPRSLDRLRVRDRRRSGFGGLLAKRLRFRIRPFLFRSAACDQPGTDREGGEQPSTPLFFSRFMEPPPSALVASEADAAETSPEEMAFPAT